MWLLNMLQILSCKVADPFLTTTTFLQLRQIQNHVAQYQPLTIAGVSPGMQLPYYMALIIITYNVF
jgi:hypothetical protein